MEDEGVRIVVRLPEGDEVHEFVLPLGYTIDQVKKAIFKEIPELSNETPNEYELASQREPLRVDFAKLRNMPSVVQSKSENKPVELQVTAKHPKKKPFHQGSVASTSGSVVYSRATAPAIETTSQTTHAVPSHQEASATTTKEIEHHKPQQPPTSPRKAPDLPVGKPRRPLSTGEWNPPRPRVTSSKAPESSSSTAAAEAASIQLLQATATLTLQSIAKQLQTRVTTLGAVLDMWTDGIAPAIDFQTLLQGEQQFLEQLQNICSGELASIAEAASTTTTVPKTSISTAENTRSADSANDLSPRHSSRTEDGCSTDVERLVNDLESKTEAHENIEMPSHPKPDEAPFESSANHEHEKEEIPDVTVMEPERPAMHAATKPQRAPPVAPTNVLSVSNQEVIVTESPGPVRRSASETAALVQNEFVETETTYVNRLKQLFQVYLDPLLAEEPPLLPRDTITKIFSAEIPMLLKMHEGLLAELQSPEKPFAQSLKMFVPFLKVLLY
eukprot:TRINITY_DN889_c0_g1_i1.p1 TRINITY_DN889_c0_g1~~TRINITY_DN889_c0_g1_i1.p1  ORF type:complete len:501 (+),score=77.99 TRINITY_DN889_c0_g1_i1:57-1559(+)